MGAPKLSDPIDLHVGERLRRARSAVGLSQVALAYLLDVSYQQIQKYERGRNRISSSKLQTIATHLSVPVAYFFEGAPEAAERFFDAEHDGDDADELAEFVNSAEGIELNRAFFRIQDPVQRRRVIDLILSLATVPD